MKNYKHVVEIDPERRRIVVLREFPDGERQLFTHVDIETLPTGSEWQVFEKVAHQLGENILMDSPAGRLLFALAEQGD